MIKFNPLTKHFRRWNVWRKRNCNGKFYKFLVLFGLSHSPTFYLTILPEEYYPYIKKVEKESK